MNTAILKESDLYDLRSQFRATEIFHTGNKQKLSHLDNLFSLALGYPHGYGNFLAAVRAGGYIFRPSAVNTMALAKYETSNISCACGIEVYLQLYADMGLTSYDVMDLCRTYLAYKLIFSAWNFLTNSNYDYQKLELLHVMLFPKKIQIKNRSRFAFHPHFGFMWWPELLQLSLSDFGLESHREKVAVLYQCVAEAEKKAIIYDRDPMSMYQPQLRHIFEDLTVEAVAKVLLSRLEDVFWHSHVFDVRAFCLWYFHARDDLCIEIPANTNESPQRLYLCENTLVLQDDQIWVAVVLTPEDGQQIRDSFSNDVDRKTLKLMLELWQHNVKHTNATWSEQQNWREALSRAKQAFIFGKS